MNQESSNKWTVEEVGTKRMKESSTLKGLWRRRWLISISTSILRPYLKRESESNFIPFLTNVLFVSQEILRESLIQESIQVTILDNFRQSNKHNVILNHLKITSKRCQVPTSSKEVVQAISRKCTWHTIKSQKDSSKFKSLEQLMQAASLIFTLP